MYVLSSYNVNINMSYLLSYQFDHWSNNSVPLISFYDISDYNTGTNSYEFRNTCDEDHR